MLFFPTYSYIGKKRLLWLANCEKEFNLTLINLVIRNTNDILNHVPLLKHLSLH